MTRLRRLAVLASLALLGACGARDDRAPGALTASQDKQLNDAAAMLDANAVDANATDAEDNAR